MPTEEQTNNDRLETIIRNNISNKYHKERKKERKKERNSKDKNAENDHVAMYTASNQTEERFKDQSES